MGWTDSVCSKVGRLILDTSQLQRLTPRVPTNSLGQQENEEQQLDEAGQPDTSSLSAFLFSFLSSSDTPSTSAIDFENSDGRRDVGEENEAAEWCVVSSNELVDHTIVEDYLNGDFENSPHLPSMSEESALLTEEFRSKIYRSLPMLVKGCEWVLMYSTLRDGISLLTLYRNSALLPGPCILVTGDSQGGVFGGLLQSPLKPSKKKYQGSNQTFVFTNVCENGSYQVFRPTGSNRYFFLCTNDALAIGGGGHFALYLENDLLTGSSGACDTFASTCLAHSEEFNVKDVELWGFAHKRRTYSST